MTISENCVEDCIFPEDEFDYERYKHKLFGRHIQKHKNYTKTSKRVVDNKFKVYQIFTGSPKSYKRAVIDKKDSVSTKQIIKENDLSCYIHSSYIINLAQSYEKIVQAVKCLQDDLTNGPKIGSKGVVVHVGKHVNKYKIDEAVKNMKENIKKLVISKDCPLLIETPAGQGTELLVDITEFCGFIKDMKEIMGEDKIGICVDTCHVHASGYDPHEYLKDVESNRLSVDLVHFNDSKTICGSKKDRHDFPGVGHIGHETLKRVHEWCLIRTIPMVLEM